MTTATFEGIDIVYWNPPLKHLPWPLGRIRYGQRANNFGDLLGPLIVSRILGLAWPEVRLPVQRRQRLLTVGSILSLARTGDAVWGSGMNGKQSSDALKFKHLEVHAVRGPLTAEILARRGICVPSIYGDPGLLVSSLFPELVRDAHPQGMGFVPNFHEIGRLDGEASEISPLGDPIDVITKIIQCDRIVASSLHGIVVAESFGIPAVLLKPVRESLFKYRDYYEGTGRPSFPVAEDLRHAQEILSSGSVRAPVFSTDDLLRSFPKTLWADSESSA